MAIETNYMTVLSKYAPREFDSFEEHETYYLRSLSETLSDTNYYTNKEGVEVEIPPVNHHPKLHEYEVWMEGYAATGEHATASLIGKVFARNFAQACDILMCQERLKWIEEVNHPDYTGYEPPRKWDYDPSKLSVWGMRLFWDEKSARKYYG